MLVLASMLVVEEEIRKRPDEAHDSRPVPGLQPAVAALPTKGLIIAVSLLCSSSAPALN